MNIVTISNLRTFRHANDYNNVSYNMYYMTIVLIIISYILNVESSACALGFAKNVL